MQHGASARLAGWPVHTGTLPSHAAVPLPYAKPDPAQVKGPGVTFWGEKTEQIPPKLPAKKAFVPQVWGVHVGILP